MSLDVKPPLHKRAIAFAKAPGLRKRVKQDDVGHALVIRALLGPGDDAVDGGAHTGEITTLRRESAPQGRGLAVEPLPHLAAGLRQQFPTGVIVEERALTDEAPGEITFHHVRDLPGFSGLRPRETPVESEVELLTVQTERLDDLVERHGLAPKLIKIDVEGAELGVLRGARRTIAAHQPAFLIEHGTAAQEYGESLVSFYDLAEELGLRIFDLDGHALLTRAAFLAAADDGYFNWLLRP